MSSILELSRWAMKTSTTNSKESPFSTLCEACARLFSDWERCYMQYPETTTEDGVDVLSFEISLVQMEQEAEKGCNLCSLVLGTISDSQLREYKSSINDRNYEPRLSVEFGSSKTTYFHVTFSKPHWPSVFIYFWPESYFTDFPINTYSVEDSTMSDTSWTCIMSWLKKCTSEHELCKRLPSSKRPKRMLHISLERQGLSVRLCENEEIPNHDPYVTMSHCWGSMKQSGLTQATLPLFKFQVLIETLSRKFQDVIAITYRLGIKWIWIDLFCIVQGSPEDWQTESQTMQDIYSNSFCNISASTSTDDRGFLSKRNPLAIQPCKVILQGKTYYGRDITSRHSDMENFPTNSRAWILQERLMSPRILHFTDNQIFWECNEGVASEKCPVIEEYNDSSMLRSFSRMVSRAMKSFPAEDEELNRSEMLMAWDGVIREYSRCQLTYETDKLIALSGLASQANFILRDSWAAGLWQRDIEYQLVWTVIGKVDKKTRTEPRRLSADIAPSWSWASIHAGQIEPINVPYNPWNRWSIRLVSHVKVHWTASPLIATNLTSYQSTLTLGLQCSLLPVKFASTERSFQYDGIPWPHIERPPSMPPISCAVDTGVDCDDIEAGKQMWCIPLFTIGFSSNLRMMHGLLVSIITRGSWPVFRRIGTFNIWGAIGAVNDIEQQSSSTITGTSNSTPSIEEPFDSTTYDRSVKLSLQILFPEASYEGADTVMDDGLVQHNIFLC